MFLYRISLGRRGLLHRPHRRVLPTRPDALGVGGIRAAGVVGFSKLGDAGADDSFDARRFLSFIATLKRRYLKVWRAPRRQAGSDGNVRACGAVRVGRAFRRSALFVFWGACFVV